MDFPQQKITIVGWADPKKIMKAIKKTRKTATIFSHVEPMESPEPQENAEAEAEPPLAQPEPPPTQNDTASQQPHTISKDVEEVHETYPHHPNYTNRMGCGHSSVFLQEPPPSMYVTQL